MKQRLKTVLANAVIVLAVTGLVFFILDIYNPLMGFMTSVYSRVLLCALFVLAPALGIVALSEKE